MSWLRDIVAGVVDGFVRAVNAAPEPKPWRYGHAWKSGQENHMCIYCKRFVPGKVRDTTPPCSGPTHHPSREELGR